jgi:ribosomal 50S subunit-recycling heat shock protein
MRLDVYLKKTLIIKQREAAKELCDKGLVKVNDLAAKPAKEIKIDDTIEIETVHGVDKYRVIMLPEGNVRKEEAELCYERY